MLQVKARSVACAVLLRVCVVIALCSPGVRVRPAVSRCGQRHWFRTQQQQGAATAARQRSTAASSEQRAASQRSSVGSRAHLMSCMMLCARRHSRLLPVTPRAVPRLSFSALAPLPQHLAQHGQSRDRAHDQPRSAERAHTSDNDDGDQRRQWATAGAVGASLADATSGGRRMTHERAALQSL